MPKVHFITQGCSSNMRESEIMMGLLGNSGHEIAKNENDSEVNVVNICTVKGDTTALREIRRIKKQHPGRKLIVAGCITESIIPKIKNLDSNISLVNTHNLGKISAVVENSANGTVLELLDKKYEQKVNLPSVRKNPVIGIVPILNGCNYFCTFCSTKLVKGKLFSYPMDAIREDVKSHLKAGCREIWITSNDTGAYMVEQGGRPRLVELMEQILSVPVDFKVRIGMMNPGNTMNILDKLIEIYKHPKMFKFLHIPVQAGNNDVLKAMNRRYSAEDFAKIVEAFRKEIPEITISTDVIVGFPSETEAQFNDTLKLIEKTRPDIINISKYALREGTIAAKMKQHPLIELKRRSKLMMELHRKIACENNKKWIGWQGKIIIDEKGKNDSWIGRNYCYKHIILNGNFKLGDELDVKINDSTTFDLRGKDMLDITVATLSSDQIVSGLEKLIVYKKLIKTDDEPPYIREEQMALFDSVIFSYKKLESSHGIRKKYSSFDVYTTYNLVRSQFIRQQIDESSYALMDMHKVYESLVDGAQPKVKQESLDKFRNALDLFRKLVQSKKLSQGYGVALPRLEQEYSMIYSYAKPKEAISAAISSGV